MMLHLIRRISAGGAVLLTSHEARKAFEAAIATSFATTTIAWPNRPASPNNTAPWLRVEPIRWRNASPMDMGAAAGRSAIMTGEAVVNVQGPAGRGWGVLFALADSVRTRFTRASLSVASGMMLQCKVASGPTLTTSERGIAQVSVRIPFEVTETVPN